MLGNKLRREFAAEKTPLDSFLSQFVGRRAQWLLLCAAFVLLISGGCTSLPSAVTDEGLDSEPQRISVTADEVNLPIVIIPAQKGTSRAASGSRGYLTTPEELAVIADKATKGIEPYASAAAEVIATANQSWEYDLDKHQTCSGSDKPKWNDDNEGTPRLYARALAYHLTGEERYAAEVKAILERIMSKVLTIDVDEQQCRLNFGWGTPELVASADLIDDYWANQSCRGPLSTVYGDETIGSGPCKQLFQNWLVKNPYYIVSLAASGSNGNWGAAATNATAYIADYLWDRPEVTLVHRQPAELGAEEFSQTPAEAYAYANQLMLDRMNGYRVEHFSSSACDYLSGEQQSDKWKPVKSQITENGIIPEDARREEYCNVPAYKPGQYENYPQIHLGNNIQQCELMLRRGDSSCFDNVDNTDLPAYSFVGPDGETKVTSLKPGRGSIERAINAIIVDAKTEWKHDEALAIAYRYYYLNHRLPGFGQWAEQLSTKPGCSQNACFTLLTHGFAPDEVPELPPTISPP